jgi:excisionase family DNA binding protein
MVSNPMNPPPPDPATPNILVDGPLLRPDEAAALLAVKTSWIYEAVRTGRLPCIRVGRHIRFTRAMLQRWLAEQTRRC